MMFNKSLLIDQHRELCFRSSEKKSAKKSKSMKFKVPMAKKGDKNQDDSEDLN